MQTESGYQARRSRRGEHTGWRRFAGRNVPAGRQSRISQQGICHRGTGRHAPARPDTGQHRTGQPEHSWRRGGLLGTVLLGAVLPGTVLRASGRRRAGTRRVREQGVSRHGVSRHGVSRHGASEDGASRRRPGEDPAEWQLTLRAGQRRASDEPELAARPRRAGSDRRLGPVRIALGRIALGGMALGGPPTA